jgi:phytoene dehydrogenase-like protein
VNQPESRHDVVVIGGGHNGLVAACYLARAGLDVAVVEQRDWLGGMTTTRPFVACAPEHLLSPGAYENVYLRASGIAADLELPRFGYRELDAAGWAWLGAGGDSLLLQRDLSRTVSEIARFSRPDAHRYRDLVDVGIKLLAIQDRYGADNPHRPAVRTVLAAVRALASDRRMRAMLGAVLTTTAADAIDSTFESEAVRGVFASAGSILCPLSVDGSAIALLASSLLHHKGAARPIGGMGGLVSALERCLRASGGKVRTGAAAVRIGGSGRADAVELENGAVLRASRAVIAACPPQLVPDLAGDGLPAALSARIRAAPANGSGVGTLTINLALEGRLELTGHQPSRSELDLRRPTLFGGSLEDVVRAGIDAARGDLPRAPVFCVAILTAVDPTQAPAGQDVVQLYGPAPVAPRAGWEDCRDEAAEGLLDAASRAAPSLTELELGRYVESPDVLAQRTGAVNGCIYHVDHLPTRMGPLRPSLGAGGYRTPLPGLYLGSAGSHPGGGVSGLPGKLCAAAVLVDNRNRSPDARTSQHPIGGSTWTTTSSSSAAGTTASSPDACSPVPG